MTTILDLNSFFFFSLIVVWLILFSPAYRIRGTRIAVAKVRERADTRKSIVPATETCALRRHWTDRPYDLQ